MIIKGVKKIDTLYEIEFDNLKINVDELTLIKYNLYKGKDLLISIDELKESVKYELEYKKAKDFLKKPRTEFEVRKNLECYKDEIIKRLKEQYLLNDEMYAISYKNKLENKRIGKNNIIKDLKSLGISDDIINKLSFERELDNIDYIVEHENQNKSNRLFIEKLKMKLLQRGFELSDILKRLNDIQIDDNNQIKIDVLKALRKYKNLDKHELRTKVVRYLMQKGYSYELINSSLDI